MADPIRQWFIDHEDEEFANPPRCDAYSVILPERTSPYVVYTTKPGALRQLLALCPNDSTAGVIGRYGLPGDGDEAWLESLANGRQCLFIGDADPPDLLVFAWLRARMAISFRGLNDWLLGRCGVTVADRITIPHSRAETAAMPLLREQVPDHSELIGPGCSAVLDSGRKVELESLFSFATVDPVEMVRAMVENRP
jgi:hypothetical protein